MKGPTAGTGGKAEVDEDFRGACSGAWMFFIRRNHGFCETNN
jgi:hypothetical protein